MPRVSNSNKTNKTNKKRGKGVPHGTISSGPFFAMHPDDSIIFLTDSYYNGIYRKVLPILKPMIPLLECTEDIVERMALTVAAYFEDKVSRIGIWSAFINSYNEVFGRWLPWYETGKDYDVEKVNLEDLKFLLWQINASTDNIDFTPPTHPLIESCAENIYDILKGEFASAPANQGLLDIITSDKLTEDFYELKILLNWLSKMCYLMAVPCWELERRNKIRKDFVRLFGVEDQSMLSYYEYSYESLCMRIGPLALYPKEWLVLIREQNDVITGKDDILAIESTPFYPFIVLSNNGDTFTVRSCRGVEYQVSSDSFNDDYSERLKPGVILITSLARYKGEWGINGLCTMISNAAVGISNEVYLKKMAESLVHNGRPVDIFGLEDPSFEPDILQSIITREKEAIEANNGNRLFYFKNFKAMMKWSCEISATQNKPLNKEAEKLFGKRPVVAFIESNGLILSYPFADSINDPSNPFFDPEQAFMGSIWLYNKFGISDEFVAYLVHHKYLTNLSFDEQEPQPQYSELIEENLPFWASFMRQYPYY